MADRRADKSGYQRLKVIRDERFELMARLEKLPRDMVFFTQITMEAAEDPDFLDAMRRANIKGALVGVESVTPEGLKDVYKDFNLAGDALAARLRVFREHGVHVLGSFIFGLPSDTPATFDATAALAQRADLTFAQFVMLTPFPSAVDFEKWEREMATNETRIQGIPLTRHWLIPQAVRPKVYTPHPLMAADEIRARTQNVWDDFYSLPRIWERSKCVTSLKGRMAFVLVSKLYRQMYANTGIATDSARVSRAESGPGCWPRPPPPVRGPADAGPAGAGVGKAAHGAQERRHRKIRPTPTCVRQRPSNPAAPATTTGPTSVSMTIAAAVLVRQRASWARSKTSPFSIQPPAKTGPPRKSGRRNTWCR